MPIHLEERKTSLDFLTSDLGEHGAVAVEGAPAEVSIRLVHLFNPKAHVGGDDDVPTGPKIVAHSREDG